MRTLIFFLAAASLATADESIVLYPPTKTPASVLSANGSVWLALQNRSTDPIDVILTVNEKILKPEKASLKVPANKVILVGLNATSEPVVVDTEVEVTATYKAGKDSVEVKRSTKIEADSIKVVASDIKRTFRYFPLWLPGKPCVDIPLSRAPSQGNVGRIYLPGPNGGIDLEGRVVGNLLQGCRDSVPNEPGQYKNAKFIPMLNGAALDSVSIEVTAKHHWLLAVFTILLGVISAFVVQRYIGVTRVLTSLRQRSWAAVVAIPQEDLSQGLQIRAIAEAAHASITVSTAVLGKGWVSRLGADDQSLKRIASEVSLLEDVSKSAFSYRKIVQAAIEAEQSIDASLSGVDTPLRRPVELERLLHTQLAVRDGSALVDVAPDMTAFGGLIAAARHFVSAADLVRDVQADIPASATADRDVMNLAWVALGQATSSEAIRGVLSGPDVVRVIASHPAPPPDSTSGEESVGRTERSAHDAIRIPIFAGEGLREEAAILRGDFGVAVFALILALASGLTTYYWDHAFGRPADYANLFTWAAGTKVAVDLFTGLLDRLAPFLKTMARG